MDWDSSLRKPDEGSTRRRTHDAICWTQRNERLLECLNDTRLARARLLDANQLLHSWPGLCQAWSLYPIQERSRCEQTPRQTICGERESTPWETSRGAATSVISMRPSRTCSIFWFHILQLDWKTMNSVYGSFRSRSEQAKPYRRCEKLFLTSSDTWRREASKSSPMISG